MTFPLEGATVLVTGGAGLVGSHLVDQLAGQGTWEIRVLDNLTRGSRKNLAPAEMFTVVSEHVFPFLRGLGGDGSAYSSHMNDARFTIPTPIGHRIEPRRQLIHALRIIPLLLRLRLVRHPEAQRLRRAK